MAWACVKSPALEKGKREGGAVRVQVQVQAGRTCKCSRYSYTTSVN